MAGTGQPGAAGAGVPFPVAMERQQGQGHAQEQGKTVVERLLTD